MKAFLAKVLADLKQVHKSFTIWFNGLMVMVAAALPGLSQDFPQLQDYMPHDLYHTLTGILIAGNIILRFKTNGSLAAKKPEGDAQ